MDVIHTAIRVADLEETIAFYEEGLGLDRSWQFTRDGVTHYFVTGDSLPAEIQFVHDPDRAGTIDPSGIDHLAVSVANLQDTFDRLTARADCEAVSEPTYFEPANASIAFVADPNGYHVELVEPDE